MRRCAADEEEESIISDSESEREIEENDPKIDNKKEARFSNSVDDVTIR